MLFSLNLTLRNKMYKPDRKLDDYYGYDDYNNIKSRLVQNSKYPWHWKQVPCSNVANCHDDIGNPMCGNCNPEYISRELCQKCNRPSRGGRYACCGTPICQRCFRYVKLEVHSCGRIAGYFNNGNEIPIMRFKL